MALVSDTLPARLLSCRPGEEEAGVFELYDQKNTNGQVCMHARMPRPSQLLCCWTRHPSAGGHRRVP